MIGTWPINEVEKKWGREEWLVNEPEYCAKWLFLKMGHGMSLHRHLVKTETLMVMEGACFYEIRAQELRKGVLKVGDALRILPGDWHSLWLPVDIDNAYWCKILEVSTHHDDADVQRLRESY